MIEVTKLLGGTKSIINKDKNGENEAHLEINVVLMPFNIVNNNHQQDTRVLDTFFLIIYLVSY